MTTHGREPAWPVYVWEAPVRIWHWVMVLAMIVLCVTGYFIGAPLPSVPGEAVENFGFGYIRFLHFAAGYIFAIVFVMRVYWAFVGNKYAREIFVVPATMLKGSYWRDLFRVIGHYAFIIREPDNHVGHNPLAMTAMFFMYVLGTVFMIVTGFALYGEGTGMGSWSYVAFTSWVMPLFPGSQSVHTWHHVGMWYLVLFAMVHMYFAIREDILSGLTVISSIVSGWRAKNG